MLQITIPERELFDESSQEFITIKERTIQLEHSLLSLSKWESKWKKPFLSNTEKTLEENIDYVRCMTITQNIEYNAYYALTRKLLDEINEYVDAQFTATTFRKSNRAPSREIATSELIYYWMVYYNIPMDCQKWHLSRLLTLIRICNIKEGPQQKMSRRDVLSQQQSLNASRKKALNTRG